MKRPLAPPAPAARGALRAYGLPAPAMISATAMAGVPALVREMFGDRVLRQANRAALIDLERITHLDCFIPQRTMTAFLAEVERHEPDFGLLVASEVSLAGYGLWGEYVLAAERLGAAINRAANALPLHCKGDRMRLSVAGGQARFSYFNATCGQSGYACVAVGTAAAMLSLLRSYLPPDRRPLAVELDLPRLRPETRFEATFGCPVRFGAEAVSICFDADLLEQPAQRRAASRLLTIEDVARGRRAPERIDCLRDAVVAQVWAQVLAGQATIDSTAQAFDTSVRSLQRELGREGIGFRELVNAVRAERAVELLRGTGASVSEIAVELGYAAPAGFARAFRHATGMAPLEFRRLARPSAPEAAAAERRRSLMAAVGN